MKPYGFCRFALFACGICASLAACAAPLADSPARSGSWIEPGAKAGALLYVADRVAGKVYVYTYPGARRTGELTGFGRLEGLCVDRSADVWVVDSLESTIVEYRHGGTMPIATLHDPDGDYPWTCAVNPRNGDLAVADIMQNGSGAGGVAVFEGAQGTPAIYSDRNVSEMISISYDDRGDIFVAGIPYSRPKFAFAELKRGRKKFAGIALIGAPIKRPGGLQYAGGKMAVGDDQGRSVVYQVSGNTITGITSLRGACHVDAFYIEGPILIAPSICKNSTPRVLFYDYPAGGSPHTAITGFGDPVGVAVSP